MLSCTRLVLSYALRDMVFFVIDILNSLPSDVKTAAVCCINLLVSFTPFLPNVLHCSICVLRFPVSAGLPAVEHSKIHCLFIIMIIIMRKFI